MATTAIGIDLGTTFCCVAVRGRDGRVEIVPNDMGNRTTPSYVSFAEDGRRLAGEAARERARSHPTRTVYDVKRMFGRRTDDRELLRDRTSWPFEVDTSDETAGPLVVVGDRRMRPEEVSGVLLAHLRQTAETYLGRTVSDAVVTVPAYFNDAARRATKDAAAIAGLNVLRILNEPTAAAIAYGLQCDRTGAERTVLVFDCGGGTFDVTLLTLEDGLFQVVATGGDPHLGGEDFDRRLFEHVLPAESRTSCSPRSLERLRDACERAKRALTSTTVATIEVDRLWDDGRDFVKTVTRSRFEALCDDLFRRCLNIVDGVLLDADVSIRDVDDVVLVGGSTRIPALQRMLSEHFGGKELCRSLHPDEAVAHGAAVQAAMLSGQDDFVLLLDVCPLSISVETAGGVSTVLIPRNTTVPVRKTRRFTTHENDQTDVEIKVFEGERTFARDNHLLGTFELAGIPAAPRGTAQIDVELALDADGVLQVTATETVSGRTQSVVIKNDAGRMSRADVEARLAEAQKYADRDREDRARLEALEALEDVLRRSDVESNRSTIEWLERDGRANATARELYERRDELVRKINDALTNEFQEL